jgi:ankyrin repeat protein
MMQTLVALGAEPAARSNEGAGAVLLATRIRTLEAVQWLVDLGLDVNLAPPGRPTALHTAIRLGGDEMVEFLVSSEADLDALDHHGRTPLEEAEFEAPTHTIELMQPLTAERPR